ncbi:MAG: tRNA (adenosine(37)-N6)-dimethylallyltransferase MiaA, partial [bacterium]|nr:tRNA (adenosine(37)-N6)-dimethylallyltransferase MiaA [bacterium]
PTVAEFAAVPHHLIDIIEIGMPFSVADYQHLARNTADGIALRGKLPILCGGTGLYVRAVVDGYNFVDYKTDWQTREALRTLGRNEGLEQLYAMLATIDPVVHQRIHANDERRIVRALEVHATTGKPLSYWESLKDIDDCYYDVLMIGLNRPREELYSRINARVESMFHQGIVEEAQALLERGFSENFIAKQAIGYKEILPYLKGSCSLDEVKEEIKLRTRRYAKRQLSWFRADKRVRWLTVEDSASTLRQILDVIALHWEIE